MDSHKNEVVSPLTINTPLGQGVLRFVSPVMAEVSVKGIQINGVIVDAVMSLSKYKGSWRIGASHVYRMGRTWDHAREPTFRKVEKILSEFLHAWIGANFDVYAEARCLYLEEEISNLQRAIRKAREDLNQFEDDLKGKMALRERYATARRMKIDTFDDKD